MMRGAPPAGTELCALADIPDPGGRGFTFRDGDALFAMFIVRAGGLVRGYVNLCPHVGSPLDFPPHQFLTPDRTRIRCATHGAVFQIDDGLCVAGPCIGRRLFPVPVEVAGGAVRIARDG